MKKRLLSTAIAVIMVFNLVLIPDGVAVFNSGAEISGDWRYTVNKDGTATIENYYGSKTSVTIPKKIGGKKVTAIGDYAFSSSKIKSVTIGSNVKTIGRSAFYGSKLTSVTIPDNVKTIEYSAFGNCASLKSVTIGSGVTDIGNYAFDECKKLTSVTIPNNVKTLGESAFANCASLKTVKIGSGVKKIEEYTFYKCKKLTSVTIGSNVKSIEGHAFYNCEALTSVKIPNSVTQIGNGAFSYCDSLKSLTIGNKAEVIGEYAFSYCNALTSVTIPDSVTDIGGSAFYNCAGLKTVIIGNGVKTIESWAFYDCSALTSLTIKAKELPTLGHSPFGYSYSDSKLKTVYVPKGSKSVYQASSVLGGFNIDEFVEYKITYKLDGGKNPSGSVKTYIAGISEKLPTPTRSGYAFAGWYTDEKKSASNKITSISKNSAKNVTVYAKWVELPDKTKSVKATANSKSKITVTWKKVSGAEGYEVYRATSKSGTYKKVKTVSKGSTVKFANKSLTANKTYYYKVRAYKTVDGKKVYGEYSAVKSAKTKK